MACVRALGMEAVKGSLEYVPLKTEKTYSMGEPSFLSVAQMCPPERKRKKFLPLG